MHLGHIKDTLLVSVSAVALALALSPGSSAGVTAGDEALPPAGGWILSELPIGSAGAFKADHAGFGGHFIQGAESVLAQNAGGPYPPMGYDPTRRGDAKAGSDKASGVKKPAGAAPAAAGGGGGRNMTGQAPAPYGGRAAMPYPQPGPWSGAVPPGAPVGPYNPYQPYAQPGRPMPMPAAGAGAPAGAQQAARPAAGGSAPAANSANPPGQPMQGGATAASMQPPPHQWPGMYQGYPPPGAYPPYPGPRQGMGWSNRPASQGGPSGAAGPEKQNTTAGAASTASQQPPAVPGHQRRPAGQYPYGRWGGAPGAGQAGAMPRGGVPGYPPWPAFGAAPNSWSGGRQVAPNAPADQAKGQMAGAGAGTPAAAQRPGAAQPPQQATAPAAGRPGSYGVGYPPPYPQYRTGTAATGQGRATGSFGMGVSGSSAYQGRGRGYGAPWGYPYGRPQWRPGWGQPQAGSQPARQPAAGPAGQAAPGQTGRSAAQPAPPQANARPAGARQQQRPQWQRQPYGAPGRWPPPQPGATAPAGRTGVAAPQQRAAGPAPQGRPPGRAAPYGYPPAPPWWRGATPGNRPAQPAPGQPRQ